MTSMQTSPQRRTLDYPVSYAHARPCAGPVRAHLCAYTDQDAEGPNDLCAPLGYITAANGLFVRAQNSLFAATLPLLAFPPRAVRGLAPLTGQITLRVPTPPLSYLAAMVAEAQDIAHTSGNEALWQVQWCAVSEQGNAGQEDLRGAWRLLRPHQTCTPSSVLYDASALHVVLTVHSHGRLPAFFSATDDRDDGGLSFQAVLGELLSPTPVLRFRICLYGYHWEVPAAVLFAPDEAIARMVASLPPLFPPGRWAVLDSPVARAEPVGAATKPSPSGIGGPVAPTWQTRYRVLLRLLRDCLIGDGEENRP
jgi:PRTRC genetic system protein A